MKLTVIYIIDILSKSFIDYNSNKYRRGKTMEKLSRKKVLIGWATKSITPQKPVILLGQFHPRISKYVNDPIMATALAIETEDDQAIMVSCDLAFIERSILHRLRESIKDKIKDFNADKIFVNATHTHTAPNLVEGWYATQDKDVMSATEYIDFLLECLSDVVVSAWNNRKLGGISWAYDYAVVGHNRRAVYFDGSSRMYGSTNREDFDCIEGYEDHSLNLLWTWDQDKNLTGIVINIACPSQVTEGEYYVSADFWHEVREELKKRYSEDLFILPQCSAGGDQSPHFLLFARAEEELRRRKGVTERQEIAERISDAVDRSYNLARSDIRTEIIFKHNIQEISLPVRKVTDVEYQTAKLEYERLMQKGKLDENSGDYMFLGRNKSIIERYEEYEKKQFYSMELHTIRLGDIAIATNPFEMFLDFGIRIKARSIPVQTFIVQLACDSVGYFGAAYLPTAKAVKGGGYGAEVASNLVGPEGGQMLVNETIKAINKMWS